MYPFKMRNKDKTAALSAVLLLLLIQAAHAQPAAQDAPLTTEDSAWYLQPWLWVIIAALLILCVVYFRRQGRKNIRSGTQKGLR